MSGFFTHYWLIIAIAVIAVIVVIAKRRWLRTHKFWTGFIAIHVVVIVMAVLLKLGIIK